MVFTHKNITKLFMKPWYIIYICLYNILLIIVYQVFSANIFVYFTLMRHLLDQRIKEDLQ